MEVGVFDFVTRKAPRFVSHRPYRDRAALMMTIALLHQHRPAEAEAFMASLQGRRRPETCVEEYLKACIAARTGAAVDAVRHVEACLAAEPAYELEIRRNPWLRGLAREDQAYA